jgi:MFS family permease
MAEPDPKHDSTILAYEPPTTERPASAAPTEGDLEQELPGGRQVLEYEPLERHDPYAALRLSNYRIFTLGWLVAVLGQQIQSAAIAWEVYQRTDQAMSLGYIGLAHFIPTLLLALPAGQMADYFDRRRLIFFATLGSGICSVGLVFASSQAAPLWMIYGLLTLSAAALTIARPSRAAILPQIVPPKVFSNAVTWNTSLFQIAAVGGPALGGLILIYSLPAAYVCAAVGAAAFCMMLLLVKRPYATGERQPPSPEGLLHGIHFVFRNKIVLATLTLDMFAVLFGSVMVLLPIFARDIIGGGEVAYGWLRAAPALGAFLTALMLAHLPPMQRAGRNLLWSVAGFGAATIVFGFSTSFWLSFVMLLLTGAFDNVSVVIRHTLVQLLTPDSLRGRVSAVNQVFIGSSNELGGVRAGAMAEWLGTVTSVVIGGLGTVVVVVAVTARWPQVRRFGRLDEARPEQPPQTVTKPNALNAEERATSDSARS